MKKIALILLCGIGAFVGWFLFYSHFFSITGISCTQDNASCPVDIQAELERHHGENSILLNTSAISKKIKKANVRIQDIVVAVNLPHELSATVRSRLPVIQLLVSPDSLQYFLVDREGVVLGIEQTATNLPVAIIKQSEHIDIEQTVSSSLRAAIDIVDTLRDRLDTTVFSVFDRHTVMVSMKSGEKVVFSVDTSVSHQLTTLQRVLNQARIESVQYQRIDLRFDQPVITK